MPYVSYMPTPPRALSERFQEKVRRDPSGCLIWTASVNSKGYGRIRNEDGRSELAHRVAWRLAGRPFTPKRELDHKCRNILCCEVEHLEEVPHHINVARGQSPAAIAHRRGTCVRGHPMTATNGRRNCGKWQCHACRREARRRQRALALAPGWILGEVLAWAADELDAQAAAHGQGGLLVDYSDHLRCFATQPERASEVPWPEAFARPAAEHAAIPPGVVTTDAGDSGPERPRTR